MRKWWIEFYMKGTDTEKRLGWNVRDKGKFSVKFIFTKQRVYRLWQMLG